MPVTFSRIALKNNNNPFQQFSPKISVNSFDIFELARVVMKNPAP
jgi:hypothetical protein